MKTLEQKLDEWKKKVLNSQGAENVYTYRMVDTYQMLVDIDKVIAEEFNHEPIFHENK